MQKKIKDFIINYVISHNEDELFREPLIGFSSVNDERYKNIKEIIGPHHLHPTEVLPSCKTIVSFFIPFTKKVVGSNIVEGKKKVSYLWAKTYYECNILINSLAEGLVEYLKDFNATGATIQATKGFDTELFVAQWSHKSAAVISGLGELGVHSLLITDKGCAGRIGTVLLDIELEPTNTKTSDKPRCLYYLDGSCLQCVDNCPTNSLSIDGLNKKVCYKKVQHTDKIYPDLGPCSSCGKCSVGPCAYFE